MRASYQQLQEKAAAEVEATIRQLPALLRARAESLPVVFEAKPNALLQRDGIEPDTLGLFCGTPFEDEGHALSPLPPQIILFLANIWDEASEDEPEFRREVRKTYLHELGHYLGLDEDALMERGLE